MISRQLYKLKIKKLATSACLGIMLFSGHFAIASESSDELDNFQGSLFPSPIIQFKSGISAYDVKCNQGLVLIIKSDSNSSACVKPGDDIKLIKIGWAENLAVSTFESLPLRLYLSTNTTNMYPEQAIEVDVSVNNTLSKPFLIQKQDNWGFDVLMIKPCFHSPVEITILKGYYTMDNMTGIKQLPIYRPTLCPVTQNFAKSYEFQSMSSQAKVAECAPNTESACSGTVKMEYHTSINGTWVSWDTHNPFDPDTYTIVGGDEWGHVAIQHFEVSNHAKK